MSRLAASYVSHCAGGLHWSSMLMHRQCSDNSQMGLFAASSFFLSEKHKIDAGHTTVCFALFLDRNDIVVSPKVGDF